MFHVSIAEIVTRRPLHTVAPDDMVRDACHVLCDAAEGAIAVVEGEVLVGIISSHDIIARAICQNRPTRETQVRQIMTPDPYTIDAKASLAQAMKLMGEGGFRHLPVMHDGHLIGVLSMRDIPTQYRLLVERFREFRDSTRSEQDTMTMLV